MQRSGAPIPALAPACARLVFVTVHEDAEFARDRKGRELGLDALEWTAVTAREISESRTRLGIVLLRDCAIPELLRVKHGSTS